MANTLDFESLSGVTVEFLQHASQFCSSAEDLVEYIKNQFTSESVASEGNTRFSSTPSDTIAIAEDGSLLNL